MASLATAIGLATVAGGVVTAEPSGAAWGDYSYVDGGWNIRSGPGTGYSVIGVTVAGSYPTFCWKDGSGYRWFRGNYWSTDHVMKYGAYVATVGIPKQAHLPAC